MKIYMAPLEGVTGFVFRNAFEEYYGRGRIDKYFIPFISPNRSEGYTTREQADIAPEHNAGMNVVPQIMANDSRLFLEAADMLGSLGYREINLNLGCPSGTVVSKYRGAGFLAKPLELDTFLKEVTSNDSVKGIKLSVKTRIGMENPEEFKLLLSIFNDYLLEELIIHPRVRTDYYKNVPDMDTFLWAMQESDIPVCYNGDVFTIDNYERVCGLINDCQAKNRCDSVMIGRGFVGNPRLIGQICGQSTSAIGREDVATLRQFTDRLLNDYIQVMSSEVNAMHKMKEVWIYINEFNPGCEKAFKKIKKSRNLAEYKEGTREFLRSIGRNED